MQDKATYFALALGCNFPILKALHHTRCFASNPRSRKEWNEFQLKFIRHIKQLIPSLHTNVLSVGISDPIHGVLNMFRFGPSNWYFSPGCHFYFGWTFGDFCACLETLKIYDRHCANILDVAKFNRDLHRQITLKTIHKSGIVFDNVTRFIQVLFQLIREWWTQRLSICITK